MIHLYRTIVFFLLVPGILANFLLAQNNPSSPRQVTLSLSSLRGGEHVLAFSDSLGNDFAIAGAYRGNHALWVKKSNSVPATTDAIHWYFDGKLHRLVVLLPPQFASQFSTDTLRLVIIPVRSAQKVAGLQVQAATSDFARTNRWRDISSQIRLKSSRK